MPELPEVETVRRTLKNKLLNQTIIGVDIYYDGIIATNKELFVKNIQNKMIIDILRIGKWLIFDLNDYCLLSHLRMEGKYFIKPYTSPITKHEHVILKFKDFSLRYHDTRKFGRMYLVKKDKLYEETPLKKIGYEPFDEKLNIYYLKEKMLNNNYVKSLLLNQEIIAGIGNIYADEILFMSRINPFKRGKMLNDTDLNNIIVNSRIVLQKAIDCGGTTIRSYTSSLGVIGNFQKHLFVHCRENEDCYICHSKIVKTTIQGRGTYYCPVCQKGVI